MRYLVIIAFLLTSAAATMGALAAAPDLDARLAGYPTLTFRLTETKIEAPATAAPGPTVLIEESVGTHAGHAFVFRVPDAVSDAELTAALTSSATAAEETPAWFFAGGFVGNGDRALSDRPAIGLVTLVPGRYVIGDPFRLPEEWAQFTVAGDVPGEPPRIKADATVDLFEMGFKIPGVLQNGRQVWEVRNTGAMLHEIALFPVPAGATKDEVVEAVIAGGDAAFGGELTDEMRAAVRAVGPEWDDWTLELAGGVGVLAPQATSWAQLDLLPGTYAAVCFIPGPDGTPHFMTGMTTTFIVGAGIP